MVAVLPPELADLDADTRDAVLALAVEIVRAPQPIPGLTQQQADLVAILKARPGWWMPYDALAEAIQRRDRADPVHPNLVSTLLCNMRGHPMRASIETLGRGAGKHGMARWVG